MIEREKCYTSPPFVLDSSGASKMAVWASMIKLILRKHTTIPTISTAGTDGSLVVDPLLSQITVCQVGYLNMSGRWADIQI